MKWLGYKRLAIKSLKLDAADIRRRMQEPHVKDLAKNIAEHGDDPIHAVTGRMPGKALLCGRDRIAALTLRKATHTWVHLAECTDLEAADLEASENLFRRQEDRDEVIRRAVAAKEALIEADEAGKRNKSNASGTASNGPSPSKQTIKGAARKLVARDLGASVNAVKQAEFRAAKAAEEAAAPEAPDEPPPRTLNLLGCDDTSTRAVCKFARPVQSAIDEADKHLRLALAALKPIEQSDLGQRLRQQVERVGSLVRSERPESVCPWCKGLPKATTGSVCGGCKGLMYVSAERAANAPKECFAPIVLIDGKPYPYADIRDGEVKPGANGVAKTKRVSVVDEQDRPIATDDDDGIPF